MFKPNTDDGEEEADQPDDGQVGRGPGPSHMVVIAQSVYDSKVLVNCYQES